jgi:hypothetical protein
MPAPIPELSVVTLTHSLEYKARELPEGRGDGRSCMERWCALCS